MFEIETETKENTMNTSNKSVYDMYNVHIKNNEGKTLLIGTVSSYHPDAEKCRQNGEVIVCDMITGIPTIVPVSIPEVIINEMGYKDADDYLKSAYVEAQKKSDSIKGLAKGKLFSVPVGDGSAFYEVVRVNKTTVKVAWRNYHPDKWVHSVLGYEGTFPINNIAPLIKRTETLHSLFSNTIQ